MVAKDLLYLHPTEFGAFQLVDAGLITVEEKYHFMLEDTRGLQNMDYTNAVFDLACLLLLEAGETL